MQVNDIFCRSPQIGDFTGGFLIQLDWLRYISLYCFDISPFSFIFKHFYKDGCPKVSHYNIKPTILPFCKFELNVW
jgi:hypothetical protein